MKQSQCKKKSIVTHQEKEPKRGGRVVPNTCTCLCSVSAGMDFSFFKDEPWISRTLFSYHLIMKNSGWFLRSHWRNYKSHIYKRNQKGIKGAYNPPQITAKQEGLCSLSWGIFLLTGWMCKTPHTHPTSETSLERGAPVLRSHDFFVGLLFWR